MTIQTDETKLTRELIDLVQDEDDLAFITAMEEYIREKQEKEQLNRQGIV